MKRWRPVRKMDPPNLILMAIAVVLAGSVTGVAMNRFTTISQRPNAAIRAVMTSLVVPRNGR